MAQIEVSRDLLVDDAVFILQCLRQNQRGGRANGLADVRMTLADSVALDLSEYVTFLRRYGYVDIDPKAAALLVTPDGESAATGKTDVGASVVQHFAKVLTRGSAEVDDLEAPAAIEALLRAAGLERAQPGFLQVASPRLTKVEGELGQGVVGRVRAARLGALGIDVAVKEIKPLHAVLPWLTADELGRRVVREARLQAQLQHPCILPVLDASEEHIVMPLAAGNLRGLKALALPDALRLGLQIARALSYAHTAGVTHGALKPVNVLLDAQGNARVSDFGVARMVALPSAGLRIVIDLGDAAYRAPEASATAPSEPPQDAYALGAILYELLAGKAPGREALVPSSSRPECPRELDDLAAALLEDAPAKRPTAAVAAARLQALLASQPAILL
jgi:hypothetical protein